MLISYITLEYTICCIRINTVVVYIIIYELYKISFASECVRDRERERETEKDLYYVYITFVLLCESKYPRIPTSIHPVKAPPPPNSPENTLTMERAPAKRNKKRKRQLHHPVLRLALLFSSRWRTDTEDTGAGSFRVVGEVESEGGGARERVKENT